MLTATRTRDDALNGYLPETFNQVVYMRDWPVLPGMRGFWLTIASAGPPSGRLVKMLMVFRAIPGLSSAWSKT